ncbi:MAG: M17 family peptidase N-terminal domain-containing protein, partial [Acetobacteraceae bacterium]
MLDVAFAEPKLPASGALVLVASEDANPVGLWRQANEATGGAVDRALKVAEFKWTKGKTCTILAPGTQWSRVVAVGLGKYGDHYPDELLETVGGHAAAALGRDPEVTICCDFLTGEQNA